MVNNTFGKMKFDPNFLAGGSFKDNCFSSSFLIKSSSSSVLIRDNIIFQKQTNEGWIRSADQPWGNKRENTGLVNL